MSHFRVSRVFSRVESSNLMNRPFPRYVMTAAHCTHGSSAGEMYVKVGEHKLDTERCPRR